MVKFLRAICQLSCHGNGIISSKTNMTDLQSPNNFFVSVNGEIIFAVLPFCQDVYCKYTLVTGPDWVLASGVDEGISQMAKKGFDEDQAFTWNLPFNIIYNTSNPSGWPQLVVSVYGIDAFGNDVVRGYGVSHFPVAPGHSKKSIPLFVPESSSPVQTFTSWLTGKRPELTDPRILTQGDAREVTKTKSEGFVKVSFDTTVRGMHPLGYMYGV